MKTLKQNIARTAVATTLLLASFQAAVLAGDNETPGGGVADTVHYVFAPYAWGYSGEIPHILQNVGQGGQGYTVNVVAQWSQPELTTQVTAGADEFEIGVGSTNNSLFTMTSHGFIKGGHSFIDVEFYRLTATGQASMEARRTQLQAIFGAGNVMGFRSTNGYFVIAYSDEVLRKVGSFSEAIAGFDACYSIGFANTALNVGARVAWGHSGCPTTASVGANAKHLFGAMNGQFGVENRPFDQAMTCSPAPPQWVGNGATTLAPAVESVVVPCALYAPMQVQVILDTRCDTSFPPDLQVKPDILHTPPMWLDPCTASVTITQPQNPPGAKYYEVCLIALFIESAGNGAPLDGNTDPESNPFPNLLEELGSANGRGPNWDDFLGYVDCIDD